MPERADFRPERADLRPERAWGDRRMDGWTNKCPPVFYRTSSPSGPLSKRPINIKFSTINHCCFNVIPFLVVNWQSCCLGVCLMLYKSVSFLRESFCSQLNDGMSIMSKYSVVIYYKSYVYYPNKEILFLRPAYVT